MDTDQLFLETLTDLEERVNAFPQQQLSNYQVVKASALLRLLLLDDSPLVDQVNRARRLKIRYRVTDGKPPMDPSPTFWAVQDGFDPDTALIHRPAVEVTRDSLLNRVVVAYQANPGETRLVSVRELIRYVAHIEGGVHAGQPESQIQQELQEWNRVVTVGGRPPTIRSLFAVGRVVIKGLEPLRAAVKERLIRHLDVGLHPTTGLCHQAAPPSRRYPLCRLQSVCACRMYAGDTR